MPTMLQSSWLLLYLLCNLFGQLAGVRARVPSIGPFAEPPPVTEAPQAALGKLRKRDTPICGYFDGILQSSLTCNAPNDCYIFTDSYGFYSAKAACGVKAVTSFNGPWGLCVNYNGGLCPNVASCSAVYTSVLFCPSNYPWCVRYEMRDTPTDPYYYVLLDCTGVYHSTAIQILFTPTTTQATLALGPSTPTQPAPTTVNKTPAPSPTPTTTPPSSTSTSPTTNNNPTPTSTQPSPTTNPTTNPTPVTEKAPSPSSSQDPSASSSAGLTVGDKAGIAGAVVGGVLTALGLVFKRNEIRALLLYLCTRKGVAAYSPDDAD